MYVLGQEVQLCGPYMQTTPHTTRKKGELTGVVSVLFHFWCLFNFFFVGGLCDASILYWSRQGTDAAEWHWFSLHQTATPQQFSDGQLFRWFAFQLCFKFQRLSSDWRGNSIILCTHVDQTRLGYNLFFLIFMITLGEGWFIF